VERFGVFHSFMGEEAAAEYCGMGPHTISHQWYRAKGNPIGEYIEVLTWEVYFIPCARWDINIQRLHIVSEKMA
jgi:hypothetical protein